MLNEYLVQAVVTPIVKSILKPTIPLSPPKQIPPHSNGRKSSPRKGKSGASPNKVTENSSVVGSFSSNTTLRQSGIERLSNPFQEANTGSTNQNESQAGQTRVVVRTEEEQQASAKERERQEILDRRDARRKSLGMLQFLFGYMLADRILIPPAEDACGVLNLHCDLRRYSIPSYLPYRTVR